VNANMTSVEMIVAQKIRAAIMRHHLSPGQKIIQEEIARELGVSRVPVREALKRLEAEGWVCSNHGRGFIVRKVTYDDVHEMFLITAALEGMAAREAAKSANKGRLREAEVILKRMQEASALQEWFDLNEQFHFAIYRITGMSRSIELIKHYRMATSRWIYVYVAQNVNREKADAEHREILRAVTEGRCEEVEKLMVMHLTETRNHAFSQLKSILGHEEYL